MRRNSPMKITMTIPVPISESDGNGIIYTKKVVEKTVREIIVGTYTSPLNEVQI